MTDLRKAAEALRLAEILSNGNAMDCLEHSADAAVELRRLHEENEALRQALSHPEQEPVAWIRKNGFRFNENLEPKDGSETPLYTAPPKREWKGLTKDDKHFLLANAWNKEQAFDGFMDAIDKFLEGKNT